MLPAPRFLSLMTIYNIEYVSRLPGRRELFDDTKRILKTMYFSLASSTSEDWWKRSAPKFPNWWNHPAEIPFPWALLLAPWKILEMLFEVVPPLKWLLGNV